MRFKKCCTKSFLLNIFLFFFLKSHGQYISSWYTTDNGLPQNSIKDIVKDKYGFIWLSTDAGLVQYDGLSFTVFNKLPITNLHFRNFYGDVRNDSIIVYNNYEENKVLIRNKKIEVIPKDNSDGIFIKEKDDFLKRITKNEIESKYYSKTKYLIKTSSGEYTFYNDEIGYTDKKEKQKKVPIHISEVYNVFFDGEILFMTDPEKRKTYRIYKGEVTSIDKPSLLNAPESKIYWQQLTNQTFIVNNDRIYLVQKYNNELHFKFLVQYENFGNQLFTSLFYDEDFNRLYLGSTIKGLNIVQLTQFYTARKKIPFVDDVSNSSLPFSKNSVIDPLGYEVNKYGLVQDHHFGLNEKYFMFYDKSGNILYKNDNTIIRRFKNSGYRKSDTISFTGLKGFFKSSNLYAISTTDLVYSYLHIFQNEDFKKADYNFRFTGFVNSFLKYNDDVLIGCSNGLYTTSLKHNKIKLIAKGINVKNVFQTQDGQTWVTTNKDGFFLFKNNKLIKMPLDQEMYLHTAHYIVDDRQGYYWISSNNGLFKVARKQLLQYADNPKTSVFYYRFTKTEGLSTNEFNGGSMPEAYSLENGDFVFPSIEGFVFFDPKKIPVYYPDRKNIYIERARINNADIIRFDRHLVLENDYKTADIFIDIPYYSNSCNLRIEAKIDGENPDWERIKINNERKYIINNLGPGYYILKFRIQVSSNGDYDYRTVSFEIKPLFYQTNAFKIALLFLLILGLTGIIHTRTRFLQTKNKALKKTVSSISTELKETSEHLETVKNDMQKESDYQKRFIEAISHDISTPVKFIAMLSQKLIEVDETDLQKEYFDSIHQSSEELYNFTMHLKQYSDLFRDKNIFENDEYCINEIFNLKKKLFQEISKEKNNIIHIEEGNEVYCKINKNTMSCIVHNLIDNAVKYTTAGKINLSANNKAGKITIKISDTGNGMSPEQLTYYNELYKTSSDDDIIRFKNYGLGLHMVIYLIKKIKAKIAFSSNEPKGTTITIDIKNNIDE